MMDGNALSILDSNLLDDISAYAVTGASGVSFENYVLSRYDSSDDFWKLIMYTDGTYRLEDDLRLQTLTMETREREGNREKTLGTTSLDLQTAGIEPVAGGDNRAAALAQMITVDVIGDMLGRDMDRASAYDVATLMRVLSISEDTAELVRSRDDSLGFLSEAQRLQLAGETLLTANGSKWNAAKAAWTGTSFSFGNLNPQGTLYAAQNGQGGFDLFSVTEDLYVNILSQYAFNRQTGGVNQAYTGLDYKTITRRDLYGAILDEETFRGWTTVQTSVPGATDSSRLIGYTANDMVTRQVLSAHGVRQSFSVLPETIADGTAYFRFEQRTTNNAAFGMNTGDLQFRAVSGMLMSGAKISEWGTSRYSAAAILQHPTQGFTNTGCNVTGKYGGRSGRENWDAYIGYLTASLKMPAGYVMRSNKRYTGGIAD